MIILKIYSRGFNLMTKRSENIQKHRGLRLKQWAWQKLRTNLWDKVGALLMKWF